jgi:folate-binding protein YgfZ
MSQMSDQYRTLRDGVAWIDRSARGRLRFDGADSARFLHALVTNDVQSLTSGQGVYAAHLTPQGRMVTDLTLHHRGAFLIADVPAGMGPSLAARFDGMIFGEDVRVTDATPALAHFSLLGERATELVSRTFGVDAGALPPLSNLAAGTIVVARAAAGAPEAFDLFVPAGEAPSTAERLTAGGAVAISEDFYDALRIEAGRPLFGVDMAEETIPLEAGLLDRAISTTKGCYVGQEIIIRVLHRGGGRVARRLMTLVFDPDVTAVPPVGTLLLLDEKEIGRVTSAATSVTSGRVIALGYLHRDAAEVGTRVSARVGESLLPATATAFAT